MLKFSICLLVLVSNFLIAQAQTTDYSESSTPVAREYKIEDKSKKEKSETETIAAPVVVSVSVPVTVVDQKGTAVNDLTAADFKVFVDDEEIKFTSFQATGDQPLNVVFLLDMSTSADFRLAEMKEFLRKLVENIRAEDKISFVTFEEKLKVLNEPTADRAVISKSFEKIKPAYGGTALYDTIADFFNKRPIGGEKTVVVMLTDGVDTASRKYTYEKSLDIVRKYNLPVTTFYLDTLTSMLNPGKRQQLPFGVVGFPAFNEKKMKEDYAVGSRYLNELAVTSGGSTILVNNYSTLSADQINGLAKLIRPQYYLAFEANAAKPQGRIKIRVNRPQLKINARSCY